MCLGHSVGPGQTITHDTRNGKIEPCSFTRGTEYIPIAAHLGAPSACFRPFSRPPLSKSSEKGQTDPAAGETNLLNRYAPTNRNVSIRCVTVTHHRCFSQILNSGNASRAGFPGIERQAPQSPALDNRFSWHVLRRKLLQTVSAQNHFPPYRAPPRSAHPFSPRYAPNWRPVRWFKAGIGGGLIIGLTVY